MCLMNFWVSETLLLYEAWEAGPRQMQHFVDLRHVCSPQERLSAACKANFYDGKCNDSEARPLGVKQEIYIGTLCQWSVHTISECRIHAHMAWFRSMLWDSIKNPFCQHGRDWSAFGVQSSHSSSLIVISGIRKSTRASQCWVLM